MIVTIAFRAAPQKRDDLVNTLIGILPDTRAFDGCNQITFTEAADDPGSLLLVEDWASEERYEAYKAWRRDSGTSVLGSDLVAPDSLSVAYFTNLES